MNQAFGTFEKFDNHKFAEKEMSIILKYFFLFFSILRKFAFLRIRLIKTKNLEIL